MPIQTEAPVSRYSAQSEFRRSIFMREGGMVVTNLHTHEDRVQAHQLRNRIFCEELGWALQAHNELEIDDYDTHAVFFGVLNEQRRLLAFLRLILPDQPFMIENEFLTLIGPGHMIRKERDTAELSRLCVAPESRRDKIAGNFGIHDVSMLLLKGVYQWCRNNQISKLYAVTEYKIYKLLCIKGFPCRLIGDPYVMPDGVIAVAFTVDLTEWKTTSLPAGPKLINWLSLV